jgi:uncharacterized protein YndB with AHSA1/START domain
MTLEQIIYLDCPPDRAFAAFTSADSILSWWGDDQNYRTCEWVSDLRPGGPWRAEFETATGQRFGASGEYLNVEPPTLVEWSWRADWEETPKRLSMEFKASESGTQLRARSEGNFNEQTEAEDRRGLSEILGWFAQHCNSIK